MTVLASLAFLVAAVVAIGAIAETVLRYRDAVFADIATLRDTPTSRDFDFRVTDFARVAVMTGKVRRSGQRVLTRRAATSAGLRAAA